MNYTNWSITFMVSEILPTITKKKCHDLNLRYEVPLLLIFGSRVLPIFEGYRDDAADTPAPHSGGVGYKFQLY
jgi:hypothetical protein